MNIIGTIGMLIKDGYTFIRRFWTIAKAWVLETKAEHKFTNVLMPIIAVIVLLCSYLGIFFKGGFFQFGAWATFFIWVGMNLQGLISAYKKLKKQHNW